MLLLWTAKNVRWATNAVQNITASERKFNAVTGRYHHNRNVFVIKSTPIGAHTVDFVYILAPWRIVWSSHTKFTYEYKTKTTKRAISSMCECVCCEWNFQAFVFAWMLILVFSGFSNGFLSWRFAIDRKMNTSSSSSSFSINLVSMRLRSGVQFS